MRKLFLLLFALAFSGSAFATTVEEAYAQCLVRMAEDTTELVKECRKDDPYNNNINLMRQNLQGAWGLLAMFPYHTDCVAPTAWDGDSCAFPPVECTWPESDNGFGECEIEECQSFELRDSVTGSCFTPPSCAATEFVNLETHECQLAPLRCPLFSHANATNDACLPDPPLACPQGQHDDGTYHCVADDATACKSDEQMGYIDGIPQCIKKVNADQAAADASAADAAAAAAKAAADAAAAAAAQAAADSAAAQAAAAAEPENQALQDAAQAAVQTSLDAAAAATAANTAATEAAAAADLERDKAQTELLKSIEENTSHEGEAPSPASVLDALGGAETETIETTGLANLDDVGLGVTRSCPAPNAYNVMGAQLVIDITAFCDIAAIIGNIVMIGAAFFSLKILTMG